LGRRAPRMAALFLALSLAAACGLAGGQKPAVQAKAEVEMSAYGFAWGTYTLRLSDAAYTTDDGMTRKTLVSTGARTDGKLTLRKDGAYVWESAWDDKVYNGTWEKTGDKDYPILLLKGQGAKDWKLGRGDGNGKGEIILFDGKSMSYVGDLAK
jgi:hypothetical protein